MFYRIPRIKSLLPAIYLSAFFFSLHVAVTTYVDSSFLSGYFSERTVGLIYTFGSILSMVELFFITALLRRFGNYAVTVFLVLVETALLFALSFPLAGPLVALAFILHLGLITLLYFVFDIFTESNSQDKTTGKTRGLFLTTMNFAFVLGPLIAGLLVPDSQFLIIYAFSSLLMLPVFLIAILHFRKFHDPKYHTFLWKRALQGVWGNKDIRAICAASFLLQFFYSWMVIYTPVYLHAHMGFSFAEIGWIFGIMLTPFVFLEIPLGKIADTQLGEKELLVGGFTILAIATFSLSFITTPTIVVWAALLFFTRVGAATIEIMSETYFFKKIDASDVNTLSLFRYTGPLAFIIGPIAATICLAFFDIQYLFAALGIIMLSGIHSALSLRDTK